MTAEEFKVAKRDSWWGMGVAVGCGWSELIFEEFENVQWKRMTQ